MVENVKIYALGGLDENGKSIGTIAAKDKGLIEHPLSNYELGLCGRI